MSDRVLTVAIFAGILGGFLLGVGVGGHVWENGVRSEALKAGAAHYEVDPQTGKTQFVWDGKKEKQ